MIFRILSRSISLVAILGFSSALCAQPTKTPTLNEILSRLEANLNHYDTRLPSLFCDEHVTSQVEPGLPSQNTVTDSVFRLKRTTNTDHTTTLVESREIRDVNGKPATVKDMDGPTLLSGAFEGSFAVVSLTQQVCMNYTLQRRNKKRPNEPYVIQFSNVLTSRNTSACLLKEKSSGRVSIDPRSMQITRLELITLHHTIIAREPGRPPVVGKRVITVDYAPVLLGRETFWMPTTITMNSVSGAGTFHPTTWTFQATYSNYHKLEVTSRILPIDEAPAP